MGINNLLITLQKISVKSNIKLFENKTIGVDGYVWIHKSFYAMMKGKINMENQIKNLIQNPILFYIT
jgi:hypothetical protein